MKRRRYSAAERAMARLHRQIDRAAAPTPDEVAGIEARAVDRVMAKAKRAAGRDDLTDAERLALATDAADNAAYVAHLRAIGRPHSPEHFARQKEDLTARLTALRDHSAP